MVSERERRRMVALLVVALVVDVGYWSAWFGDRSLVASTTRPAYYEFENAFPLADAWLGWCCAAGAVALHRRSPRALLWLLGGAGAGAYLFGMDVLYDLEHGIWWRSGAGGGIELAVNLLTLAFTATFGGWAWRRRVQLLGPGQSG